MILMNLHRCNYYPYFKVCVKCCIRPAIFIRVCWLLSLLEYRGLQWLLDDCTVLISALQVEKSRDTKTTSVSERLAPLFQCRYLCIFICIVMRIRKAAWSVALSDSFPHWLCTTYIYTSNWRLKCDVHGLNKWHC